MAYFHEADLQWHTYEENMHKLLRVPPRDNPTSPYLRPGVANILLRSPLFALGTAGLASRLWTTIWEGESGSFRAIGESTIVVRAVVDRRHDPVIEILLRNNTEGELGKESVVSCIGMDLEARNRVKLCGRITFAAFAATVDGIGELLLDLKVEQSLG